MPKISFTGYVELSDEDYKDIDDVGTVDNWLATAIHKASRKRSVTGLDVLDELHIEWDLHA